LQRDTPVFPPAPGSTHAAVDGQVPGEGSQEEKEAERLGKIDMIERVFADPVFWTVFLLLNFASPVLFPVLRSGRLAPLYVVAVGFVLTIVYRTVSLSDLLSLKNRPSEEEARREVESSRWYDDAVMADKGERYGDAATLYEKLLAREQGHIQARFNLARIYHRRLNDTAKALLHYQALSLHAPKDHPFYGEAMTGIQELRTSLRGSQRTAR
jgi:hypothetical protein